MNLPLPSEDLLLIPASAEERLDHDWNLLRPKEVAPGDLHRMTKDELKAFIQGVVQGTIFTSDHLKRLPEWYCETCEDGPTIRGHAPPLGHVCPKCETLLTGRDVTDIDPGMVFLPIALGLFDNWEKDAISQVGGLWAYNRDALPRGINGYPMFTDVRLTHVKDWAKARKIICRELERLDNIEIGDDE